ncbi:MAG: transaldolase family protein [Anaerolineae bacterium]
MTESYLKWLVRETPTTWWHDSADPDELAVGLTQGASGVTTNPYLTALTLRARPDWWAPLLQDVPEGLAPSEKAEDLLRHVARRHAATLLPVFQQTGGAQGYVCGQVNPSQAADADAMLVLARRIRDWAPNMAVKLPVTRAGLEVLEECAAEGITVTATVSFTVPQVLAVAEAYERGLARAKQAGVPPGRCFPVIMIGRLDDYLRDVAHDRRAAISETDIRQAGLAVTKRAYALFRERGYGAVLLVAALRGNHHMVELAGAEIIMSISPDNQARLLGPDVPREQRIDAPIAADVIARLCTLPEFVRAYEPDGMAEEDFITYGVTQRTLTQFIVAGWALLEGYNLPR